MPMIGGFYSSLPQTSNNTPSDPSNTSSLTQVMMGLAISFTPNKSGKVFVSCCGQGSSTLSGDGLIFRGMYGTGTAPTNGAAVTGTGINVAISQLVAANAETLDIGFCGIVTLTPGTTYWFDIALAAVTGGTASVAKLTYDLIEFPL